jgi:ParB family chromosome partitioning protein
MTTTQTPIAIIKAPPPVRNGTGEVDVIKISQISAGKFRCRKDVDSEEMEAFKSCIRTNGVQTPICVRVRGFRNGCEHYEIVYGHRRVEACIELGIPTIEATIYENLPDADAAILGFLENFARQELNAIEETEAIIQILSLKLNISKQAVTQILWQFNNHASRRRSTESATIELENRTMTVQYEKLQKILTNVIGTGNKLSLITIASQKLPLLKLPEELDRAVRTRKLDATKAVRIARVKDPAQRQKLLKMALEEDLSIRQLSQYIKKISSPKSKNSKAETVASSTETQTNNLIPPSSQENENTDNETNSNNVKLDMVFLKTLEQVAAEAQETRKQIERNPTLTLSVTQRQELQTLTHEVDELSEQLKRKVHELKELVTSTHRQTTRAKSLDVV